MCEWDGRPPTPERSGWHWLGQGDFVIPAFWNADLARARWEQGDLARAGFCSPQYAASDAFTPRLRYVAPLLTPKQVRDRELSAFEAGAKSMRIIIENAARIAALQEEERIDAIRAQASAKAIDG